MPSLNKEQLGSGLNKLQGYRDGSINPGWINITREEANAILEAIDIFTEKILELKAHE